ncbi:MAG: Chitinase [Labilithrix sp.]|nr:Chitinase [Labilithrix sp.]
MAASKLRFACLLALVSVVGGSVACSASGEGSPGSSPGPAAKPAGPLPSTFAVTHENEALGVPSFVWLARSDWPAFERADDAAAQVASAIAPTLRLGEAARKSLLVPVIHDTGRGAIVARFGQRVGGVEVFRGGLNLVLSRDLAPIAASGLVAPNVEVARGFERSAEDAIHVAHRALTGHDAGLSALDHQGDYERFRSESAAFPLRSPARAKRVYFPRKGGLEPGWFVELLLRSGVAHSYVVSAVTGAVLFSNDLVRHDAYSYRVWASPTSKLIMDGPQGNEAVPLVVPARNGFTPTFIPQELVTLESFPFSKNDPWLPPGATTTKGNNVEAYSDVAQPDGFTPQSADTVASTTSDHTFDYVTDTSVSAGSTPASVKAAITQMFYTTNFLHDWYYDSGFDEKSGNHQRSNLGRGGAEGDPLLAETQDFSGRNNANASTPADGASPVIQMYLFSGKTNASLVVEPPAANAGDKPVGVAGQFGKDAFDITGPVVVTNDGAGDAVDGCDAPSPAVAGKIALVHRGGCAFAVKAQRAQAAGAAGVVIINVASSADPAVPPFMGGTALDVTIPVLSLNAVDGQALEGAAAGGVTVRLKRDPSQDLDGALDGDIVSHEWGHVLSNRLIADGSGLDTNQAGGLGEGWGDFSAMMVSVRKEDADVPANAHWAGIYPTAAYATSGDSEFYFGIRRVPYSTDLSKDPLTFKHIADGTPLPTNVPISFGEDGSSNSEVHNTGEVWATMLWECYASLLASGRFSFEDAQARMKAYFVQSLKLTPPSPTMLEARDAVLAAAYATDKADFDLFWKAFAKRGAGVGALGPSADSPDNVGVTESFEVGNFAEVIAMSVTDDVVTCDHDGVLDEGELGTLTITVQNRGAGALSATTAKLSSSSPLVSFPGGNEVSFAPFAPFETRTVTAKIMIDGVKDLTPAPVDITLDDPSFVRIASTLVQLAAPHGRDEVAASSKKDDVEPEKSAWTVASRDVTGTSVKWQRVLRGNDHVWFVPNAGEPADHTLTSPALQVTDTKFTLQWRHHWSFESEESDTGIVDYDGGVVEISLDGGASWVDLSTYAKMDYNTTLADDPNTTMVLKGRPAYGRTSPGYPDAWVSSRIEITLPAPQASAMVRFRHGADDNAAADGWEIDDIAVSGIDNTPFSSLVAQRDLCDPAAPVATAPPGRTALSKEIVHLVGGGSSPRGLPVSFSWRQEDGPSVYLSGRDTAELAFEAPDVARPTVLTFALRANDGTLVGAPATVAVEVRPLDYYGTKDDSCGCRTVGSRGGPGTLAWAAGLSAVALAVVRRRRQRV